MYQCFLDLNLLSRQTVIYVNYFNMAVKEFNAESVIIEKREKRVNQH